MNLPPITVLKNGRRCLPAGYVVVYASNRTGGTYLEYRLMKDGGKRERIPAQQARAVDLSEVFLYDGGQFTPMSKAPADILRRHHDAVERPPVVRKEKPQKVKAKSGAFVTDRNPEKMEVKKPWNPSTHVRVYDASKRCWFERPRQMAQAA